MLIICIMKEQLANTPLIFSIRLMNYEKSRDKNTSCYEKEMIFMTVKFTNVKTGKVVEINLFDQEQYMKYMTDSNYLLTM